MGRFLHTTTFGVRADTRERLRAARLDSFGALMHGDLGEPFKRKAWLDVHRLTMPDGSTCYLKRSHPRPVAGECRRLLRWARRGLRPHTEAFHVCLAERALGSLGFAAMPVLAWGEQRLLGLIPRRGVVLAAAVEGVEAGELFRAGTPAQRLAIARAAAELVGRLHACGLFVSPRLHDLIVPPREPLELVMIDLDFKGAHLRPAAFNADQAIAAAAHALYLLLRTGDRLSPAQSREAARAYLGAIRQSGAQVQPGVLRGVRTLLRVKLAAHAADPGKARAFPAAPASV